MDTRTDTRAQAPWDMEIGNAERFRHDTSGPWATEHLALAYADALWEIETLGTGSGEAHLAIRAIKDLAEEWGLDVGQVIVLALAAIESHHCR